MKKYISNIKSFVKSINKQNIKEFMLIHKNALIVIIAIVLLGGIITAASYAYYSTLANQAIVGGQVGTISNINMYVYVEDKNESTGAGLGTYSRSVYVPQYAYTYNSSLSYCKKGSTLTYNSTTHTFSINNTKDACYVYFDASLAANADIILDIYQQKNGEYKKINEIPNGYILNTTLSSCTNGATMNLDNGQISVNTANKTVCSAYLDKLIFYWNDSFTGTYRYSYPLGQRTSDGGTTWTSGSPTTYPTLGQLQNNDTYFSDRPVYIKTTTEHQVCLYYNNHEFCFGANYWEGTIGVKDSSAGLATKNKLQPEMETALGTSANGCNYDNSEAFCYFDNLHCYSYYNGNIECYTDLGLYGCTVYDTGNAICD